MQRKVVKPKGFSMAIMRSTRIRRNKTSDSMVDPTSELLFDLVFEILIRLPVKTLLQFKSVCKSWRQLIEDPNFMKKQHDTMLKRISLNSTPSSLFVITRDDKTRISSSMWLRSRDKAHNPNSNQNPNVVFGNYPFIIGISNGLVWAASARSDSIICNPTTGQTRKIPQSSLGEIYTTIAFYGISFADNEYKLFSVVHSKYPSELIVRAEMYSIRTNLWRLTDVKIGEFDARLYGCCDKIAVVMNDVFYWGAYGNGQQYMVTYFDMKSSICGVMKGPSFTGTSSWQIIDFKGELGLINCLYATRFNMWLLNEKERSWTMKLRVEGLRFSGPLENGYSLRCLGRDSNGDFLMKNYISYSSQSMKKYEFFMYDSESQAIMYLPAGNLIWRDVFLYTESLLPV